MAIDDATRKILEAYEERIANGGEVISTSGSKTTVSRPGADYDYKYTNGGTSGGSSHGTSSNSGGGNGGYGSGSGYGNRETAYTWSDGTTTYSNATDYRDAAKQGNKQDKKLVTASTYMSSGQQKSNGSRTHGNQTTFTGDIYSKNRQTGYNYDNALRYEQQVRNNYNLGSATSPKQPVAILPGANGGNTQGFGTQNLPMDNGLYTNEKYGGGYGGTGEYENNPYNVGNPYAGMMKETRAAYDGYEDRIRELNDVAIRQGTHRLEAQKGSLNQSYEHNAKQAYANYLQQQHAMPEVLSAGGITGGATESMALGLENQYQSDLNNINQALTNAIMEIDNSIIDLQNSGDLQAAQQVLQNSQQALAAYQNLMQSYINYDYKANRDAISDGRYNREYADSQLKDSENEKKAEYDRVLELISNGFSVAGAAEILGISQAQIDEYLKYIKDGKQLKIENSQAVLEGRQAAAAKKASAPMAKSKSTASGKKSKSGGKSGKPKPAEFPDKYVKNGVAISGFGRMSLAEAISHYTKGELETYINPKDGKLYFKRK